MSICSIEDVRAATQQPFWFQQYLMKDRGFNQELIDRAAAAQCSALMLTLDLQVIGERRRDPRNGLTIPPRLTLRNASIWRRRPAWACGCCSASGARSAIWSAASAAPAAYARWPNGPRRSSMRRPTGAMSSGCAAAGLEN